MNRLEAFINTAVNSLWGIGVDAKKPIDWSQYKVVAHRGVHEKELAVENTLKAFDLAHKNGIWGIEFDVRLTQDMEPVIHHDPSCERIFKRPDIIIEQIPFVELRKEIPEIPHLNEIIEAYGKKTHLMIEIKEDPRTRKGLKEQVLKLLHGLSPEEDYHLLSLNPDYLESFKEIDPMCFVDVAWINFLETFKKNKDLGHGGISGFFPFFGQKQVQEFKSLGKKVGTGFIESKSALIKEHERGVDWIFTNHPLHLKRFSK